MTGGRILFIIVAGLLSVGVFAAGYGEGKKRGKASMACDATFEYIHESVWCNASYVIEKHAYTALRNTLLKDIEALQETEDVRSVSVYFRDLRRGPAFGINEYEPFFPASLLKIVLVTTYYDVAQEYPEILSEVIWSTTASTSEAHPVLELLKHVAQDSDTEAYTLLRDHLDTLPQGEELLRARAHNLGFPVPDGGVEESISAKDYSSMLHSLFFARLLPPESANEILELMRAPHGASLLAPEHVPVSRRFGTQARIIGERLRVHECGIVYFPGNPYSLCIVLTGYNEDTMRAALAQLASKVYEEVESRRIGANSKSL